MRQVVIYISSLFLWIGLASGQEAKAWGKLGHLTVCDLAYRNFTDHTRDELKRLFQVRQGGIFVKGRGKLADRHYTSYNLGCLEEDEMPRRHKDDHFINVSRDTKSIVSGACPAGADCILSGIGRDFAILKDATKPNEERVFALMALGHWIGDIHQPLHVSFADDRGGNGIDAKVIGRCGTSRQSVDNLHAIWDNCLLEAGLFERVRKRVDFKKSWTRNTITYRAVDTLQANTSLAEEKQLVGMDPWKWADESFEITLQPAVRYCTMIAGTCRYSEVLAELPARGGKKRAETFDQAYLAAFERTAMERIKAAGFRLAHLVNLALDPSYTEPVRDNLQKP
ncbi:S1/P1 nuclease [Bosea sp. 2RAB26]|uniref:S1/P1 nuclease n=1 Tax=Bosea sp. 2RAB26 TaxID=3237476 RepID=UPI003F93D943